MKKEEFFHDYQNLSKEAQDFISRMTSYHPNNRISINDILKHKWFKEVKDKNKEQLNEYEKSIGFEKYCLEKDEELNKELRKEKVIKEETNEKESSKSINIDLNKIFNDNNIKLNHVELGRFWNYYIYIKGYLSNHKEFMKSIIRKITSKYEDDCEIESSHFEFKFNIKFIKDEDNKNIKVEKENENKENDNYKLIMTIILYQTTDGYYLRFVRLKGDKKEFFDRFNEISDMV